RRRRRRRRRRGQGGGASAAEVTDGPAPALAGDGSTIPIVLPGESVSGSTLQERPAEPEAVND
ncbi:MAG: hypothetical protein ACREN2_03525, partial [Candidatus Dormibacteria bacterium]